MQTTFSIHIAGSVSEKVVHAIEFDRIAIPFSEQALHCTRVMYCDEISKCVCTVRFWVYPDRIQLLFDQVECPSGSLP